MEQPLFLSSRRINTTQHFCFCRCIVNEIGCKGEDNTIRDEELAWLGILEIRRAHVQQPTPDLLLTPG